MSRYVLAYVPVVHRGYLEFFRRHQDTDGVYLFGTDLVPEADYLQKEIRALSVFEAKMALTMLEAHRTVRLVGAELLSTWRAEQASVVVPDEDVCRAVARRHLSGCRVTYDRVFLRWDRDSILRKERVQADRTMGFHGVVAEMLTRAEEESLRASNWWRQVGAVVAREGRLILTAHNHHLPSDQTPYIEGDPRNAAHRGQHIELSTDFHAEAALIAEAARRGIPLAGADLYVTTFPCPPCAKLVAASGIQRLFFLTGYAMVDGLRVIRQAGIEVIHVEKESPQS